MTTVSGLSDAARDGFVPAYHGLGVTEEQFFNVSEFFIDVLDRMNVEAQLVEAIGLALAGVHDQAVVKEVGVRS